MASRTDNFFSIKLTRFYMKMIGFWYAETERDDWMLFALRIISFASVIIFLIIQAIDAHHYWGNFDELLYNICLSSPIIIIALKMIILMYRRGALLDVIVYSEKTFWNITYDEFGQRIMKECEKQSFLLLCLLSFAVYGAVYSYVLTPIFENFGKNETERVLPVRISINFPVTRTPYYEIMYIIETLAGTFTGTCFFIFDNLLGIFNIHVAGQFRILQNRLENLCEEYADYGIDKKEPDSSNIISDKNSSHKMFAVSSASKTKNNDCVKYKPEKQKSDICAKTHEELKHCIEQHLVLIDYVQKLDNVFNLVLLCEVGISSIFICVTGFQILIAKRLKYIFHFMSAFIEMLIFTWTGNNMIVQSEEIGERVFRSKWYMMPDTRTGRSFRQALILIMIRARRACYISAGKFTPISLQTFTSILSTTMSYLSLMRKLSDDANARAE